MTDLLQSDEMYCFLDTDVLIHFTNFDQADWVTFLNAKQVHLVLPITVVDELNKHKDNGSKPRLQQRARDLLPKIAKLLVGADGPVRIKEGVFLMATRKEPRIEWSALELDENVQDDRILARILLFRDEYPERDVRFLTNDYAAMLKADDRDIPTLMPDGKVLAPKALKSTVEAELETTRKELHEYKNRAPKLEFGFDNGQTNTETIICPSSGYNTRDAEVLTQALNEEYIPKQIVEQRAEFERILKDAKGRASDYDVTEFTDDYDAYLKKLEAARKRDLMSKYGQRCELTFLIRNVGTAPITDLAIEIAFPAGTLVIDADDEKREIMVPKEPKASWIPAPERAFGVMGLGLGIGTPNFAFVPPRDPTWDLLREVRRSQATYRGPLCNQTTESHIVTYRAKKLRQEGLWVMPPIVAYLIPKNRQGFSITYEIFSDQGLKKISGMLTVQWEPTAIAE
jgi:hypothetical protein